MAALDKVELFTAEAESGVVATSARVKETILRELNSQLHTRAQKIRRERDATLNIEAIIEADSKTHRNQFSAFNHSLHRYLLWINFGGKVV